MVGSSPRRVMTYALCVLVVLLPSDLLKSSAAGCGGNLTAPSGGPVTSPNYPSNYGDNDLCEWLITVPAGSTIRLTFDSFDTEDGNDVLLIYDGASDSDVEVVHWLTGHQSVNPITSTSNVIFLRFTSNDSGTRSGFRFSYTSHAIYETCGLSVFRHFPQTGCGGSAVDIASHIGVTLEFCIQACCASSTCLSFQYNTQNTNCYLKNKLCSAGEKVSAVHGNMYDRLDGCPNGYSYLAHTHLCYRADVSESTYDQALTTCQSDGGTLAMPRDNTTNDFLIALKNDANPNIGFWFGLDRKDGSWNYVDGGELSYTDWGDGEPNNAGGAENCAMYIPATHASKGNNWNDAPCSGSKGSICEVGANVALGKTAFQTSSREPASVAVDGNTATNYDAGSCTHTVSDYGEDNPAWWVDLGQSYVIDRYVYSISPDPLSITDMTA
ncbi:scavenger receptor cysteine-rich domain-containing protein DMBT1-like [Branchiostoma floridae x Branchiostoma japonicum]